MQRTTISDLSPEMRERIRNNIDSYLQNDRKYQQLTRSASRDDLVTYVALVAHTIGEALGYILTIPVEYARLVVEELGKGIDDFGRGLWDGINEANRRTRY